MPIAAPVAPQSVPHWRVGPRPGSGSLRWLLTTTDTATGMHDEQAPTRRLKRQRRANVAGGRERTGRSHRVYVSEEEEVRLAKLAAEQRVTVPRLLVESALSGVETSTQRRATIAELFALRRSLAGMANNVNQIARAANTDGRAPVGTAAALQSIVGAVEKIDATIDRVAAS